MLTLCGVVRLILPVIGLLKRAGLREWAKAPTALIPLPGNLVLMYFLAFPR